MPVSDSLRLVSETCFTDDGLLEVKKDHSIVNVNSQSMAIGLRHSHDISLIFTRKKGMALMHYICNYATKLNTPMWKQLAHAAEILDLARQPQIGGDNGGAASTMADETKSFLLQVANRIFTSRELSLRIRKRDAAGLAPELLPFEPLDTPRILTGVGASSWHTEEGKMLQVRTFNANNRWMMSDFCSLVLYHGLFQNSRIAAVMDPRTQVQLPTIEERIPSITAMFRLVHVILVSGSFMVPVSAGDAHHGRRVAKPRLSAGGRAVANCESVKIHIPTRSPRC